MKRIFTFIVTVFFLFMAYKPVTMAVDKTLDKPFILAYSQTESPVLAYGSGSSTTTPNAVILSSSLERITLLGGLFLLIIGELLFLRRNDMGKKVLVARRTFTLVLIIVLSSGLFLSLYHFNNKYTHAANQAVNGALYVSKDDWSNMPIRCLRDGWRYYGERLLTPETLKEQGDDYRYLSIGEETNFALGNPEKSPHGSASYAMTLYLPDEEHTYCIEFPDIYSSYRFYVDDTLKLQMGNPDPEAYQDTTQFRTITFDASGKVTLLLAVSDKSWIYSGLVYPPSFGESVKINTTRGIRMFISLIIVTMALMLAALSIYLAIWTRGRKGNIWIHSLLCLTAALLTSYSVVHAIIPLPIQPWYSLELVSGYLLTLLVIILHNRICNAKLAMRLISEIAVSSICIISLLYGLFSSQLTLPVMYSYADMVFIGKVFITVYLLLITISAVNRNIEGAAVLVYADIVYACSFVWDHILPNYEPILGGGFQEWGSLALVIGTGILLWYDVAKGYWHSIIYVEEQRQMKRQITMQVEHLRQMNQKVEESSKLRHDFRHHLHTLMALSEERQNEKLENYIRGITDINEGIRLGSITENVELDALVQYNSNLAKDNGIQFCVRLQLPSNFDFPIVDLCGIIGNLLENAIEACQRQRSGNKTVFIAGRLMDAQLEFIVDNSFEGELKTKNGKYLSSKRSGYGLGIASVLDTVEHYNGIANLYADEKGFHAQVSLPLVSQNNINCNK